MKQPTNNLDSKASMQACLHCGNPCADTAVKEKDLSFCCRGCSRVYALLHEEGLDAFYRLRDGEIGIPASDADQGRYDILEHPTTAAQIIDHQQDAICRVTFKIPAIHCTGCVWLLENLYSLFDGFGRTEVDILRKEARIEFDTSVISLADVARELDRLGYAPDISMASTGGSNTPSAPDRLALKIGIAGFAFGNIMLMSFPSYLGLDLANHSALSSLFNTISLVLTLPVLIFSASEFWKNSWRGIQHRALSIDVPIAIGLLALFGQSLVEILSHQGLGYLDSLSGLVFFLLVGKWYQRRTTDALSFDRDYQSYFPLLARRLQSGIEEAVPIQELTTGDRIYIRNTELIPADCILLNGNGLIDYSFVTGESAPQSQTSGDHLYAGGRQCGEILEAEIIKPVSHSYLTSLWNHATFSNDRSRLASITDKASLYFTPAVLTLALATLLYWLQEQPSAALPSMVAVLIVACPCALALSAPFAFGQAMRILGKLGMHVRSADVVDQLGRISDLLFDKTGTLTTKSAGVSHYTGSPLSEEEKNWVRSATHSSTHPHSQEIAKHLQSHLPLQQLNGLQEQPGLGLHTSIVGHQILIGSEPWLRNHHITIPNTESSNGSHVHVAIDGIAKGCFTIGSQTRRGIETMFSTLKTTYTLHLLTGDHSASTQALANLFPFCASIHSSQTPHDKLDAVVELQQDHRSVAMIGDGLNDSGALKQSDVGISVTDDLQAFVPACDAILHAAELPRLPAVMAFAKATRQVVLLSFTLSIGYNLIGFYFAATHQLTPVAAAILMPLSSITIVTVATLGTRLAARITGVQA